MPQIKANGITLEYESFGPEDRETVLLIMGLGAQLTMWPVELCDELVARGYRVIRFDNRDVGLSTKFDEAGMPDMTEIFGALMAGKPATSPYSLDDMAADAVGLLDALGIGKAHIAGASMGGMIAQLVATNHPERTLSLVSIMSTTGNPA
ncbi:MAG: alpha/beta fold hydrolase, partial [Parvibaculum sp.]|nr:alpha/beta fold hydrolase [Parvibaculum sp.]